MKRFSVFVLAGLLLLVPAIASSTPIVADSDTDDSVDLTLEYTPGLHNDVYYTDYQSMVDGEMVELFCVQEQGAHVGVPETYDLYTLSSADETTLMVAWLAETWWQGDYDDTNDKAAFQELIWSLLDIVGLEDKVFEEKLFSLSIRSLPEFGDIEDHTGNWLLASNEDYQDYLIRSVPEPATLLLLGTGLVGLAGMSRRKFKK